MKEYIERASVHSIIEQTSAIAFTRGGMHEKIDSIPAADVAPVRRGRWKYYHKQNKAVCTNCSFERDLSADFGAAIACPNCGAIMEKE